MKLKAAGHHQAAFLSVIQSNNNNSIWPNIAVVYALSF